VTPGDSRREVTPGDSRREVTPGDSRRTVFQGSVVKALRRLAHGAVLRRALGCRMRRCPWKLDGTAVAWQPGARGAARISGPH